MYNIQIWTINAFLTSIPLLSYFVLINRHEIATYIKLICPVPFRTYDFSESYIIEN